LAYTDNVVIEREKTHAIQKKKSTEALLDASKEVGWK
jgi:hypothetical protein